MERAKHFPLSGQGSSGYSPNNSLYPKYLLSGSPTGQLIRDKTVSNKAMKPGYALSTTQIKHHMGLQMVHGWWDLPDKMGEYFLVLLASIPTSWIRCWAGLKNNNHDNILC